MAQYIKFRLTAAKASVSMAFLALLGGVAAKAGLARSGHERTASAAHKYDKWSPILSTNGLSSTLKIDIKLIEGAFNSLYYKEQVALQKVDQQLKIDYQKLNAAESRLYKEQSKYIKLRDADARYLRTSGTAVNALKLDGLPGSAFLQGDGSVFTGGVTVATSNTHSVPLLSSPGGLLTVSVIQVPGSGPSLIITNNTGALLPAVLQQDGPPRSHDLKPGDNTVGLLATDQLQLQSFPTADFKRVATLTVSVEGNADGAHFVGQLLLGNVPSS